MYSLLASPTPSIPFPTAWPGWGCALRTRASGQHATNPDPMRFTNIFPRRIHHLTIPKTRWSWNLSTYYPTWPVTVRQQDNLIQKWLANYWADVLTSAQRAQWATFAADNQLTNVFGTTKLLSGWGAFCNLNRLYIVGYVIPGHPPALGQAPRWITPPGSWPTLATLTLTNPAIAIRTPPPDSYIAPVWYIYVQTNWPSTGAGWTLQFYASYPGTFATKRRQGQMFLCASVTRGNIPFFSGWTLCWMWLPAATIGKLLTVAYCLRNDLTGGISPLTWLQLTLSAYP